MAICYKSFHVYIRFSKMLSLNFLKSEDNDNSYDDESYGAAVEIKASGKELLKLSAPVFSCNHNFGDEIVLKSLSKDQLHKSLEEDIDWNIKQAEESHSDLVSGVYEGGLKIWECTFDLGQYLINKFSNIGLEKKIVLDLGCGAGLLGILASKLGAEYVDFQDYNLGVIKHLTIPNVLLNLSMLPRTRFWSGDWGGFNQPRFYDLILTSETIYNPKYYFKLHELFKRCLKLDGVVILAAKSYYFGVGGSIGEFLSFIEKENVFKYNNVWCSNEGIKREIIELHFRNEA